MSKIVSTSICEVYGVEDNLYPSSCLSILSFVLRGLMPMLAVSAHDEEAYPENNDDKKLELAQSHRIKSVPARRCIIKG